MLEIVGVTEAQGEYQGQKYHNLVLHTCEPFDVEKGYGQVTDRLKLKWENAVELLNSVKGDKSLLVGLSIQPIYNKFGNVINVLPIGSK